MSETSNTGGGSFLNAGNDAIRATGVGASESAALFGLNPWFSLLDLWRRKTGIESGAASSEAARWGNILEPIVAAAYAEQTGNKIIRRGQSMRHKQHDRVICTPDYKVVSKKINIQIKTASGWKSDQWGDQWTDQIPDYILVQVQHEMAVLNYPVTHVPVLLGGQEMRIYEVLRDDQMIEQIIDAVNYFWSLVETRTQPDPQSIRDLETIKPEPESSVAASEQEIAAWSELQQVNQYLKEAKDRKVELEESLKLVIGEQEALVDGSGAVLATWKPFDANWIDSKALKTDHPEIYQQYVKQYSSRRFNIKRI